MSPSGSMDMLTLMAGGASSSERISPALDSEESTSPLSELKAEQLTRNSSEPPDRVETLRMFDSETREEAAAAADTGDKSQFEAAMIRQEDQKWSTKEIIIRILLLRTATFRKNKKSLSIAV